jgi:iron-sulfur cluster assembly protein
MTDTTTTPASSAKARAQAFLITEKAAERVRSLMEQNNVSDEVLLVGVKTKGCSGLSYDMRFVKSAELPVMAEKVNQHGVSVAVDPKAAMFLFGTTMDYNETPLKSGFEFINPNEAGRCGCGESFTVSKKSDN